MVVHTNNKGSTTTGPVNGCTHKQQGLYINRTSEWLYTQTTKVVQQQDKWMLVHTNNKGCPTTRPVNVRTHKQQGLYNNRTSQYSYTQTTKVVQQQAQWSSYTQTTKVVQQQAQWIVVHTNNKGCTTTGPLNTRTHKQQGLYNNTTTRVLRQHK